MLAIIDSYPTPESSQKAIEEAYFLMPNTFQTALMGLDAAIGLSTSRCTEFRDQLKLRPTGPRGPLVVNNQLRGWAKYYGQFYSHDADEQNPEYDTTLHGGMFGYDKSVGAFLFGMSGGAASYSTDTDLDAKEDTTAYHGTLYGTYGTDRLFFNGGLAYGYNQVETHTRGNFLLDGDFDAQLISGYLAAGYDFLIQKPNLVLTPEIAVRYASYEQDAYTETSSISVPRQIDGFDADSLQSRLGLNFSMLNASVFKTFSVKLEGRFHWMHEFNPDPGAMTFQLDGGTHDYQLLPPMLDEDLFRAGVGVSFFNTLRTMPKNLLFRIDFDELFGDGFNSHQLSAKVIYAF
jgi:outer membrane autotransporter protein